MQRKYIILVLILIVFFTGFFASAQVRNTDVNLSLAPENPAPNQSVTATLGSQAINLDKANISWSINGENLNQGIGKKSFSFNTGKAGSLVVLSVSIDTIDGQSISKNLTFTPAGVDMLWEAPDAYTPPFYKGMTLVPSQGAFKVVAIPSIMSTNGKVNPNNLSYTWIKDGKIQTNSSGWGKSSFVFQNSYLDKTNSIEVKVSDISGSANASGKMTLRTTNPKILFYENNPSLGIMWNRTLSDGFVINADGSTLTVEPYFFSPKNLNASELTFDWSLNGTKIETPNPKNMLSIKPEQGQSGSATIKILINNIDTLFQSMTKQIQVSF
jgi:hypothetical protein